MLIRWVRDRWRLACAKQRGALSTLGLLLLCAAACGCGEAGYGVACYGVESPPGDPTVTITDFSYQPASIKIGDTIKFTAEINKQSDYGSDCWLTVDFGNESYDAAHLDVSYPSWFILNDSGQDGDAVAGDLVYSYDLVWSELYNTVEDLPVTVSLKWWDSTPDVVVTGPAITVTEADVEAQE